VVNRPGQERAALNAQTLMLQQGLQLHGHALHSLTIEPHFQASSSIRKQLNGEHDVPLLVKHYIDAMELYR